MDDQADERVWHYCPVACARCGTAVLVAKFSPEHTSVQWTREAALACAEFAARHGANGVSAPVPSCGSLRTSIDAAVTTGQVAIQPP